LAGVIDELCLTLLPTLAVGSAKRIIAGPALPTPAALSRQTVLEEDGYLFLRHRTTGPLEDA
jgi:hypothetical protein